MHSLALLVLCLLVWVPTVSYGQSEAARPPPPDAPTLPPLVPAPEEPEEPEDDLRGEIIPGDRFPTDAGPDLLVPRMILSPLLGGVSASCGAILGLILGAVVSDCSLFEGGCSDFALIAPAVVTGWATGSLSVYGLGNVLNGRGALGPTMLGGALGMGLGIAMLFASEGAAWFLAPLAPGLAASVGYELSNSYVRSHLPPARDEFAGVQLMPVVSTAPGGGLLGGLVGRF